MPEPAQPLVSVIMPSYNAEAYIADAIASVLAQTHTNLELLIVNDGSTDRTASIIATFNDPRITVFHKENGGIGMARNVALDVMKGEFLCLCDSDDTLPPRSIQARVKALLADPDAHFCDGMVVVHDRWMERVTRVFTPTFTGEPLLELASMTGSCFFGPSWMVRLDPGMHLRFNTEVSHAEDLLFHVEEPTYNYRVTGHSSMSNIEGLARSLEYVQGWMKRELAIPDAVLRSFGRRRIRIVAGTYFKQGRYLKALKALFS
jgi:teichuronic acid biosynthesis glycosyltransferase TuaG